MKSRWWLVALVAAIILAADQLSKYAVVQWIGLGGQWNLFPDRPGLLAIVGGMNTGTACGYFPQFGAIFTFAPFLILTIIVIFYRQQAHPGWLLSVGTGLIIGGAFGNLIDRIRYGFVVDFIALSRIPVFNVADAAVSTAVVILLFWSLREDTKRVSQEEGAGQAAAGTSWKLMLSFLALLGVLAFLGAFVCIWLPTLLPRP